MNRRPTVVEVADRAGVSIASVSRVLNGKPARPDTEDRVRAAVAELGYVPDATGRALKLGATMQVAFAVDDVGNPVYTEMMRGVEEGMAGSGARLLVASTGHDLTDLVALVRSLSRGYADGLIISPLRRSPELVDALVNAPVPVVVVGDIGEGTPLDTVRTDSRRGVVMAHAHLLETGRRRIAFVNGPADTAPGRARSEGYQQACAATGSTGPVVEVDAFTVAAGEKAWATLGALDSAPPTGRGDRGERPARLRGDARRPQRAAARPAAAGRGRDRRHPVRPRVQPVADQRVARRPDPWPRGGPTAPRTDGGAQDSPAHGPGRTPPRGARVQRTGSGTGRPVSGRVVVVGSVNMDVAVRTTRLPKPGETLLAETIQRSGGGKGANQAVGAARAGGADTAMVGAVGSDGDGDTLLDDLRRDGIDVTGIRRVVDHPTGVALITIDADAENTIVVAAGANAAVQLSDTDRELIGAADVVLAQLEIPQRVVADAASARRNGARFVLNAAPAAPLIPELRSQVDVLVVNEHEAVELAQLADVDDAVRRLLDDVPAVLVTLGSDGARLVTRVGGDVRVESPRVTATDTVAAGDTFCGVYAASLAQGHDERTCLERACAAASLAVQRAGAQASVPTAAEVDRQARAVYGGTHG